MRKKKRNLKNKAKVNYNVLKTYNFNLIAYSPSIFFEDTFVFETEEEAQKAFEKIEVELEMFQGWWYGKEQFVNKVMKDYPNAQVIWLQK